MSGFNDKNNFNTQSVVKSVLFQIRLGKMSRVAYIKPTNTKPKKNLNPFKRKVSFKILKNGKTSLKITLSFKN